MKINSKPPNAGIGILNPSCYEEVLVVRVHPEILDTFTSQGAVLSFGLAWFLKARYLLLFETASCV